MIASSVETILLPTEAGSQTITTTAVRTVVFCQNSFDSPGSFGSRILTAWTNIVNVRIVFVNLSEIQRSGMMPFFNFDRLPKTRGTATEGAQAR